MWTTAESGLYLIAACLPSLRPLLKHIDITTLRSRLSGYSNRIFSRYGTRGDTYQIALEHSIGRKTKVKVAGISSEQLHGNKRLSDCEYERDVPRSISIYQNDGP